MVNTIIHNNNTLVYGIGNKGKSLIDHFLQFFTFVRRGLGQDNLMKTFLFNSSYLQPFCELDSFSLFSSTIYVCP